MMTLDEARLHFGIDPTDTDTKVFVFPHDSRNQAVPDATDYITADAAVIPSEDGTVYVVTKGDFPHPLATLLA